MNEERIGKLENLLKIDPEDTFTKYALALEYQKQNKTLALGLFEELLEESPDYIPTYYQAAHLYIDLGEAQKAEQTFKTGIEKSKSDLKTNAELRNAYQNFLLELED